MSERMVKLPAQEMTVTALKALLAEAEQPTFQVGEWTITTGDGIDVKAARVTKVNGDCVYRAHPDGEWWTYAHKLRHATPEEIAAATRIVPKVGMLLKRKLDGAILRCYHVGDWIYMHGVSEATNHSARSLSTEDYDVLDSYTVQGVR